MSLDDIEEFTITRAVKVIKAFGKPSRSWFFSEDDIREVGGKTFVHVAGRLSTPRHLFGHLCKDKKASGIDVFSKTDVLEKLTSLKNRVRKVSVQGKENGDPRNRSKDAVIKKLQLNEIVSIDAPTVGDVQGVTMAVLPTPAGGKDHGLWVELTSPNLLYISKAVAEQFNSDAVGDDECSRSCLKRKRPSDSMNLEMATDGEQDANATAMDDNETEPATDVIEGHATATATAMEDIIEEGLQDRDATPTDMASWPIWQPMITKGQLPTKQRSLLDMMKVAK